MLSTLTTFAIALLALGCHREPAIQSCRDPIGGQWQVSDVGPHHGESWALLDRGATLEMYPLFNMTSTTAVADDAPIFVAQPMINATRSSDQSLEELIGRGSLRITQGGTVCVRRQYVAIEGCRDDVIHVAMPVWQPPSNPTQCATGDSPDVQVVLTMHRISPLH